MDNYISRYTGAQIDTAVGKALDGGINGVSPVITTSKSGKVTTLTITDAAGTKTVTINDGADGAKGANGAAGKDGVSPTISVSKSGKVTTLTITDVNGTKTAKINDGADGSGGTGITIPTYWQTHLDKRVVSIREAMAAAGWNKSAFFWYSDVHWTYGHQKAPMLLKYLYQHTPVNKTVFGGDIVDNEGDDTTMSYLWDWRAAVRDLPNHHSVPGNHDDGNSTDNRWDDPYIYAYLLAAEETPDVVRGGALYYHIDNPTEKTRYLYLDTATKDGNICNDTVQQEWLKAKLKSTPSGWHIVAIGHIWRTVDYSVTPPVDAGWSYGGAYCIGEFDKYNARTGEYASCTGTGRVEFCIGGHTHVDADFVSDGGIPVILTECDAKYVRSGLTCTAGTITEASVNAVIADYTNGYVRIVRIGRGKGRTIMLDGSGSIEDEDDETSADTPVLPDVPTGDFTNVLTAAGYTENMRYSTGSASDVTATGWDLTGYIPATKGDVIRFANVTWYPSSENSGRGSLYWFDSSKTFIGNSNITTTDSLSNWQPVYDEAGNVSQITVPSGVGSSTAYIRICCQDITAASVITVNEKIYDDDTGGSGGETPETPVVPDVPTGDFTNVLTEVGFTENSRFSSSSKTDTAATGWDITGYIPAKRGDTIRMINVDFVDLDGGGGATSRAMVYSFDADKTYITCSDGYSADNKMSDAWSPVYDADGDTVQFTIPSSYSSTVAYIRIGARDISQYSVITVNEAIE